MSNSQPDFRNGTKEYSLRQLVHGNCGPAEINGSGVGLKLTVETTRETRRRLARQNKKSKPTTVFKILTQLN